MSSQPSESADRKGKGILIEEPKKKSKKLSSSTQVPESVQSTPAEQEEKISDEVVESTPQINPESSTLQSTTNPEGSNPDDDSTRNPDKTANPDGDSTANPDGNSSANPDGHEDADPDPEDQGVIDTHGSKEDEVQD